MFKYRLILIFVGLAAFACAAQPGKILVTTLNCHAFFGGGETHMELGQPETSGQFWQKAQNLVNLWPTNPPTLVALQEIGGAREAVYLARLAAARYGHSFQPVFAETKDTFTGEAVGAIVDLSQGWKISGKPGRAPGLDRDLSRHLVLQLTNRFSSLAICVVHLKRPIGQYGRLAQQKQCAALKSWTDAQLASNPRANVIVLGDFNETAKPGAAEASLASLVPPTGALRDTFVLAGGSFHTHAYGKAYDRILISHALEAGEANWRFDSVFVQRHSHGKGAEKNLFTDHFPVTAVFEFVPRK